MNNRKGFTLIEILSVIIIIGIIMLIAIPAVSRYILKANKSAYATNAHAFVETIRAKYEMKEYGALLKDDEIMVVPIGHVILEKGDNKSSPYGDYEFTQCYVLIVPENYNYKYFVTLVDSSNTGIVNVEDSQLSEDSVTIDIDERLINLENFKDANSFYTYNNMVYKRYDVRKIEGEGTNQNYDAYVFKNTGIEGVFKVMFLYSGNTVFGGADKILEYHSNQWHYNNTVVSSIPVPIKKGYTYKGYYKDNKVTGLEVIDVNGDIVPQIEDRLDSYTFAYADYTVNELIFNINNINTNYSDSLQSFEFSNAMNGTDNYTYTKVSEKNSSEDSTNYITISGTNIKIQAGAPANTYTVTVNATDDVSGATKDATFTINIARTNAICPTTTDTTVTWDDKNHSIGVSGGYGGTVEFSSNNSTWSTANPTRKAAGSQTTYVRVVADSNHNSVTCTSRSITINKASSSITCTDRTYNGNNQNMYTTYSGCTPGTNSSLKNVTNGAVTVTCTGDSNHNNSTCTATMKKAASSITCTDRTYNGNNQNMYTTYSNCTPGTNSSLKNATNGAVTVTCTGDSNHNNSTCTATMKKAASSITCTDRTYNGNNQNMYTTYSGCTPGTNSSLKNATNGAVTVTCTGDSNHNNSTCTATMKKADAVITCSNPNYNGSSQSIASCSGGTVSGNTRTLVGSQTVSCSGDSNHNNVTKTCSLKGCNRWECENCGSVSLTSQVWRYYNSNCNLVTSGWIKTGESYSNPDNDSTKYWFYIENSKMFVGWFNYGNGCYSYLNEGPKASNSNILSGKMITSETRTIGGVSYTFNANGMCYAGGCSEKCNY